METVDGGEERFFGMIADDPHPKYQNTREWIVVADTGVGWRSSPVYNDRAAGQGPARGEMKASPGVSALCALCLGAVAHAVRQCGDSI
jgi:hypothetical protein